MLNGRFELDMPPRVWSLVPAALADRQSYEAQAVPFAAALHAPVDLPCC